MIIDFSSIITLLQYSTASLLNNTNYVNLNNEMRKISLLDIFPTTNNKLYVKGDQAYTCNLQP